MPAALLPGLAHVGRGDEEWDHAAGVDTLQFARANADHYRARQYRLLADQVRLVRRRHPDVDDLRTTGLTVDGRRVDEDVLREAALEIVAVRWADAAMLPLGSAADAVREAVHLDDNAGEALDALDEGRITGRQFDVVVRGAGHLRLPTARLDQTLDERGAVTDLDVTSGAPVHTGADLDLVEERYYALAVAEAEDGLCGSALGRRCRRLTLQLTPGYTAVRLQERDDHRTVEIVPCDDGVQAHVGFLLPLGEAARLDRWLTAAADAAADHSFREGLADERSHGQRRHDVLLDSLAHAMATGVPAASDPAAVAGDRPGTVRRRHHRPASSVQVHLTVSARTLLGLDDDPAEIAGLGPVSAADARRLAGLDADVTWRKVVLDPGTREVVDVGAREYRPSAALRRWVTAAHPTCAAPGDNPQ